MKGQRKILNPSAVKIQAGIPIPPRSDCLQKWGPFLLSMSAGESFLVTESRQVNLLLTQAKRRGVRITTRKINGEGWRVWRLNDE